MDVEAKIDELLNMCRNSESMDFSRRQEGGLGIIGANAALNTFCELGCPRPPPPPFRTHEHTLGQFTVWWDCTPIMAKENV